MKGIVVMLEILLDITRISFSGSTGCEWLGGSHKHIDLQTGWCETWSNVSL